MAFLRHRRNPVRAAWLVPPARDASLSLVSHRIPGVGNPEELVALIVARQFGESSALNGLPSIK